jgi:hypothetical protein
MLPGYFGALTIVLLISIVIVRVWMLNQRGIVATKFGTIDKTDFLIPPFAFLYFYLIFAGAFNWPAFAGEEPSSAVVTVDRRPALRIRVMPDDRQPCVVWVEFPHRNRY